MKSRAHAELASAIGMRDQMTKQRVQYINRAYAMLNSHGVKIKKKGLTGKVGFERAMNSREWSKVERATLQSIAIQLEAIRESRKVLDAEITALAETLPGHENLSLTSDMASSYDQSAATAREHKSKNRHSGIAVLRAV